MSEKLAWGILSTGRIAHTFAQGVQQSETGVLAAVGSRSQASADKFGDELKIPRRHGSYEALLADKDVQAVYIATPHPGHAEWAIKAAEAGKHLLCEKPVGLNHAEAMAIIEAAQAHKVFFMEAFMYRCHPQMAKLVELIREKVIGDVRVIQVAFSFQCGYNLESRLLNHKLGGGGILDVGCYCVSMANLIAGAANGKECCEPLEVKGTAVIGAASRVDEYAVASVKYPGNVLAQLATGVQANQENVVRVFGSTGMIFVPQPWGGNRNGPTKLIVRKYAEKEPQEVLIEDSRHLYAMEADMVGRNIARGQAPSPAMTIADSLANMKTTDMWRAAIGLQYDCVKPDAVPTITRRPLAVRKEHNMKFGPIAGLEKPVSRMIMGAMGGDNGPYAAVMYDDFIERGGNAFDTAYIYGGGACDRGLGSYIKNRGIRKQVVVIGKGAHTPFCTPEWLTKQLKESLDRLQTDFVDIYIMHRDNPDVPVGEFVTVLNEHQHAGRMTVFGGSNWTLARVEAFNAYAEAHGLKSMSLVNNNFALARMVDPVWAGCITSVDAASRAWFTKTQMPLFSWSSQARGFFTDRSRPDDKSDKELARCWYSEDNFQRKQRAEELAKKRGVLPINIALAYVLCQPFPTYALIGPRTLAETRTALPGLDVKLTPEEMRWLNLEA
jgi:predicted dehydrogenase/aryl-alcohol dehydrogenase-like predicted oxidoreductase